MTQPPNHPTTQPPGFFLLAALLVLLGLPHTAQAQTSTPPHIEQVWIGYPGGEDSRQSRNGAWVPVYVRLKAGKDGNSQGSYRLVIETSDFEDSPYTYGVPVPALLGESEQVVLSYVHPGSDASEFTVRLQTADGQVVQTLARLQRGGAREVLNPRDVLFLAVGSRLPGLRRALADMDRKPNANPDDLDRHRLAFLDSVALMPDRWFGYEAADVVVLATGGDSFVSTLLQESESARRAALVEWVRRGGRLILSVGRNHQLAAKLLEKMPLLDCAITGGVSRKSLPQTSAWGSGEARQPLQSVETARLAPSRGVTVSVREDDGAGEGKPIIVEGSCGLGHVVLVAFDLDTLPFTGWDGQHSFWQKLQTGVAPKVSEANVNGPGAQAIPVQGEQELLTDLKRGLETFEDIPVISFGWVALFILLYILVVGPLDYLVLKKVFKRLELTWVTFPATVLVISVAAYFTAYYLKGDDLRINKIDIVDIDLHAPQQAYGTTWFALFSPRIQNYTLGLEPAPGWVTAPPANGPGSTVMSVLEGPGQSLRTGSQGLFRRPYEYAEDASGLERVPIPVWATQSFTASWRAPLLANRPPIEAELHRSRTEGVLWGTIKNNLPIDLQKTTLFYHGWWYAVGDLPGSADGSDHPGFNVEVLFEKGGKSRPVQDWFTDPDVLRPARAPGPEGRGLSQGLLENLSSYQRIKAVLFHRASGISEQHNSGLRPLDQSWRIPAAAPFREEVILVGRAPLMADRAETVTAGGASPSRLWLDRLPGSQPERPALPGYLTQETYVRVYIPVKSE